MADHSKNGSSGTEQAVKMCTCTNMGCPNHPRNHDRGYTPCIEKNLTRHEIPACFSRVYPDHQRMEGYTYEAFARFVLAHDGEQQ